VAVQGVVPQGACHPQGWLPFFSLQLSAGRYKNSTTVFNLTAMSTWKTFPKNIPADQEVVWVRVKYYYSTPFLATYFFSEQKFVSITNEIYYPAWTIARWKPQ